jgi:hypothetical protein
MIFTLLMMGVVIVIFALMFALVQFSDSIIRRERSVVLPVQSGEAIRAIGEEAARS